MVISNQNRQFGPILGQNSTISQKVFTSLRVGYNPEEVFKIIFKFSRRQQIFQGQVDHFQGSRTLPVFKANSRTS